MISRTEAQSATPTQVVNGAARIGSIECQQWNNGSARLYLQVFNNYNPTVGTTKPDLVIPIPAKPTNYPKGEIKVPFPVCGGGDHNGMKLTTGFAYAVTTTPDGSTGAAVGLRPVVIIEYDSNNQ